MQYPQMRERLAQNAQRIVLLVQNVSQQQARWRPDPDSWSMLEVINHLCDEEREDFRVRLDIILHYPEREAPPIDPLGWVRERRYNERDLEESIGNFLAERQESLEWLKTVREPEWDTTYEAPFGQIRAGDIFSAWVAHDLLHMRQLVELHYAYLKELAAPYSVDYAGEW